jgi:hypothetical protein
LQVPGYCSACRFPLFVRWELRYPKQPSYGHVTAVIRHGRRWNAESGS